MTARTCPACGLSRAEFARRQLAGSDEVAPSALDVVGAMADDAVVARPMTEARDAADRVASVVASWAFPLTVLALIVGWLVFNVAAGPLRPFPTVLLAVISAVLASLGALQGPVILRVQRRQRQRDRLRDEIDHRINLRAELEVRWLEHKLDHLLETPPATSDPGPTDGDR